MKDFWVDAAERIVATMAEAALGAIGASTMITEVDWKLTVSVVALAGIVTFLKCVVVKFKDDKDADYIEEDEEEDEEEENDGLE